MIMTEQEWIELLVLWQEYASALEDHMINLETQVKLLRDRNEHTY